MPSAILRLFLLLLIVTGGCAHAGAKNVCPADTEWLHSCKGFVLNIDGLGGLSAFAIEGEGDQLFAVSDRGKVLTAAIVDDPDRGVFQIQQPAVHSLVGSNGKPLKNLQGDAESVTRVKDGWVIGFEREHRLVRYGIEPWKATPRPWILPMPPGFQDMPENGGVEALTALKDGRLLAIEEGELLSFSPRHAWIGGEDGWETLTYNAPWPWRPVDAATLPNGDVLVLERQVDLFGTFSSRIMYINSETIKAGATLQGEEIARLAPPQISENFEGMAVHQDTDGKLYLYLVSDNNFSPLQRTVLLKFELSIPALQ